MSSILYILIRIEELWTGDLIKLISTDEIGTYEGMDNRNILFKYKNKIRSISPTEIYILSEKEQAEYHKNIRLKKEPKKRITYVAPDKVKSSIDLHLDVLDPAYKVDNPARILDFQLDAFIKYMKQAIAQKHKVVTIIHGLGKGVLKAEVLFILEGMDEVMFTNPTNNGGAIEVWLKHSN